MSPKSAIRICHTCLVFVIALANSDPSYSYTRQEREALDFSEYVVTDPNASYFDVEARRTYLRQTDSPVLLDQIQALQFGASCRAAMNLPLVDHRVIVPGFYQNPEAWREYAQPFFAFEDAVSKLAAAQIVAADRYHADCLVDVLYKWAGSRAFEDFHYEVTKQQAWFQIESSLFAAAMALSTVRQLVGDRKPELAVIDSWLLKVARRHVQIPGQTLATCCNNHFYRRALYATMIGVMTHDNDLFRFGVSAIYSALDDATPEGALPLEMRRGRLAAHYQNFATIYLVFLAQIIERQGYDIFSLEIDGKTLDKIVNFSLEIIADPARINEFTEGAEQEMKFLNDDQYFSWMELYLTRSNDNQIDAFLSDRRPLYNRSAGGFATLYFYTP